MNAQLVFVLDVEGEPSAIDELSEAIEMYVRDLRNHDDKARVIRAERRPGEP